MAVCASARCCLPCCDGGGGRATRSGGLTGKAHTAEEAAAPAAAASGRACVALGRRRGQTATSVCVLRRCGARESRWTTRRRMSLFPWTQMGRVCPAKTTQI